jgi:hypothetical protein
MTRALFLLPLLLGGFLTKPAVAKATGTTFYLLHVIKIVILGPDRRSILKEGEMTERERERERE